MNLIFCLSYLSLNNTVILIEKYGVENVKVITSNKSIEKLFLLLYNNMDSIHFLDSSSLTLPKKAHQFFLFPLRVLSLFIKKKKAWNYFREVKNCNVYFFFNSAAFFHAWLIYKLIKKNKLFYDEDLNLDAFKEINTKVATLNKKIIKILYKEEVIPLNQEFATTYKMSSTYLTKCNVKLLDISYTFEEVASIISSKIDFPKGEILYLPPLLDEVQISKNLYIKTVDSIIENCQQENLNIHLKRHPRSEEIHSKESQLFEIPLYYPASCLIDYKITIGLATATLYERVNTGGVAISIIKILMKDDLNLIESTMNYLNSNLDEGKEIIYPENISELMNVILYFKKLDD